MQTGKSAQEHKQKLITAPGIWVMACSAAWGCPSFSKSVDPTAGLRTMVFRMSIATASGRVTSEHRGVETTKNSAPLK